MTSSLCPGPCCCGACVVLFVCLFVFVCCWCFAFCLYLSLFGVVVVSHKNGMEPVKPSPASSCRSVHSGTLHSRTVSIVQIGARMGGFDGVCLRYHFIVLSHRRTAQSL